MPLKPAILVVDDDPGVRAIFQEYLSSVGYSVRTAASLGEGRNAVMSQRFDAVLLDMRLPDGNGLDWIPDLRERHSELAIVVITGEGEVRLAVEAMRRGADNFLTKPVELSELDVFLRKSLETGFLRRSQLAQQMQTKKAQPYFGESAAMKRVAELAAVAAQNDSTIILQGETGTGKGVLARWLHENGPRSSAPFVELNCSSLRGELLASELFGHVKGAFTSAVQDRKGLIEVANGGTLFLDEIGDMDIRVQAQFLNVIEEKQYRRLGEVKIRRSEFRLICATNRDLQDSVRRGEFRQDLYFRINVFPITLPPLRERREDIPGLAHEIMRSFGRQETLSREILDLFLAYPWPGNIRELRNVLERAILLARGRELTVADFSALTVPPAVRAAPSPHRHPQPPEGPERPLDLDEQEQAYVRKIVEQCGGDTKQAAKLLGISRATLYRKLKKPLPPQ